MKKLLDSILSLFGVYKNTEIKELSSTVTTDPSSNQTLIDINGYEYVLVDFPFQKEGAYPKTIHKNSVFEYITSHHLLEPFEFELIDWLKNEVRVKDHPVSEHNLCYFIRRFLARNGYPVAVASIHSQDLQMVMVIELNGRLNPGRGINHIASVIDAIGTAEEMQNGNPVLFSPYKITQKENMVSQNFKADCGTLYCFALKYE